MAHEPQNSYYRDWPPLHVKQAPYSFIVCSECSLPFSLWTWLAPVAPSSHHEVLRAGLEVE